MTRQSGIVSSFGESFLDVCVAGYSYPNEPRCLAKTVLTGGGEMRETHVDFPPSDHITGLSNRHLNSNKGLFLR